ncbi:hypothetical protein [Bdellovibrio sp. HCB274]|uniref:hypothetical protein n=1 Tax=Bdellovibrio sp. HCB274 TaxID=3394361 RepID=UPI0039B51830
MKTLKLIFLLLLTVSCSNALARNDKLVGNWIRIGGDSAWGRIDIDDSLRAKGYRMCGDILCGEPVIFRLASYGQTRLTVFHTRATGSVTEPNGNFTATEIIEVENGKMTVREYQKSNTPGYPSLIYTMIMAKGRR